MRNKVTKYLGRGTSSVCLFGFCLVCFFSYHGCMLSIYVSVTTMNFHIVRHCFVNNVTYTFINIVIIACDNITFCLSTPQHHNSSCQYFHNIHQQYYDVMSQYLKAFHVENIAIFFVNIITAGVTVTGLIVNISIQLWDYWDIRRIWFQRKLLKNPIQRILLSQLRVT